MSKAKKPEVLLMSDLIFALMMFLAGILGLLFPYLLKHFKNRVSLESRHRWTYLDVENRFEKRIPLSWLLVAVSLIWILTEKL